MLKSKNRGYATESGSDEEEKPKKIKKGKRKPKLPTEKEKVPMFTFELKDQPKENFNLTEFSFPKLHKFETETIPKFETPISEAKVPTFEAMRWTSEANVPTFEVPSFEIPTFEVPSFEIPTFIRSKEVEKSKQETFELKQETFELKQEIFEEEAKPEEAKPEEAKPEEAKPEEAKPEKLETKEILKQLKVLYDRIEILDDNNKMIFTELDEKISYKKSYIKHYFFITGGLFCYSLFLFHELQLHNFF